MFLVAAISRAQGTWTSILSCYACPFDTEVYCMPIMRRSPGRCRWGTVLDPRDKHMTYALNYESLLDACKGNQACSLFYINLIETGQVSISLDDIK